MIETNYHLQLSIIATNFVTPIWHDICLLSDMNTTLQPDELLSADQFCSGKKGVVPLVWCGPELWLERNRYGTPTPEAYVADLPMWRRSTVLAWAEKNPERPQRKSRKFDVGLQNASLGFGFKREGKERFVRIVITEIDPRTIKRNPVKTKPSEFTYEVITMAS
jgi:hypothetical protein